MNSQIDVDSVEIIAKDGNCQNFLLKFRGSLYSYIIRQNNFTQIEVD
jgi:hypothetical protein